MRASTKITLPFALAAAVLSTASAQVLTCTAFVANQPILRQESTSEAAGDIVIGCTATSFPLFGDLARPQTLTLYVAGAQITSRTLYTGSTPSSIPTDAALLVNDNVTGAPVNGASPPTQGFFQDGALIFSGFTFPTSCPGGPAPACSSINGVASFTIRITNVRLFADALQPGSFAKGTVLATFGVQNQQGLVLGVAEPSLSVQVSTPIQSTQQCGQQSVTLNNLTVGELFANAFKIQTTPGNGTPGGWYQSNFAMESQTVLSNVALANTTATQNPGTFASQVNGVVPGQADAGTRIRINLFNVPSGVSLSLPVTVTSGSSTLIANAGGDLGAFSPMPGNSITLTADGSVTYEVRAQNAGAIDTFNIPIMVTSNNPSPATILISATYAATQGETITQVPRFADTSFPTPFYNLVSCLPPNHLSFVNQPATGSTGVALSPVTVSVLDMNGHLTTSSPSVTVTSNPGAVNSTVTASGGMATFNSLVFGLPGTFTLTANSPGLPSATSIPFVIKATPTVTLSSSASAIRLGQSVTLTAGVSPSSATGSVMFYDGVTPLGAGSLVGGQTAFTTSLLGSGTRALRARYAGDAAFISGISPTLSQVVNEVAASTLTPSAIIAANTATVSVAVGDFNGDGIADLATADYNSGTVSVLLGNRGGGFKSAVHYAVGSQSLAVAVGDFNGDGKMDLVSANSLDGTLSVLLGRGDGTFPAATTVAVAGIATAVTVGDFNNDGIADLAVTDDGYLHVSILIGNGDGTFKFAHVYTVPSNPRYTATGDFNGDGATDLAVACTNSNSVTVLLGRGDGTFQIAKDMNVGGHPQSLVVADLNGDGRPDLATANPNENSLSVLIGNGDGSFQTPTTYGAGDNSFAITVSDLNGDGVPDLVTANSYSGNISVLYGNGSGAFTSAVNFAAGNYPVALAVADINGDGRADVVAANNSGGLNVLLGSSQTATQLRFTTQPANGGKTIGPVVVQVQDAGGNLVTSSEAPVTLTSTPAGVTTTVTAVTGIATFNNLVFGASGTYTFTATSPEFTPATSVSFNVVSQVPSVTIDSPTSGTVLPSTFQVLTGWAIDNTTSAAGSISIVKVAVDGTLAGTAAYGIPRPDVCTVYPGRAECPNVGWIFALNLATGTHVITVSAADANPTPNIGTASVTITVQTPMTGSKAGVFRNNVAFLLDSNGSSLYEAGTDRFIPNFTGPGGFAAGDVPVTGDWTGDGKTKVGIYRASTGTWYLDANNNGVLDIGDFTYSFGGLAGDMPFVGDWTSKGKSCIGIYRSNGSLWLLDLNCNGTFDNTPTDAFFPFGGLAGDVPVVGAWTGGATRVGVVRKYAPAGVPIGNPFFWVPDAGAANAGNLPVNHPPDVARCFAFGGLTGDVFVAGDWYNTGTSVAGVYRAGYWVLDAALPGAPQANHTAGLAFGYGGVPGDIPVVGKW